MGNSRAGYKGWEEEGRVVYYEGHSPSTLTTSFRYALEVKMNLIPNRHHLFEPTSSLFSALVNFGFVMIPSV